MNESKNKKLALAYFHKNKDINLGGTLTSLKSYFQEIFILNLNSTHSLESNFPEVKIINPVKKDLKGILQEFSRLAFKADYLLLLEDNEIPIFKPDFFNQLEDLNYQVLIRPQKREVFNYEEELFTFPEKRLISLNRKNLLSFSEQPDFFYSDSLPVIPEELLFIEKSESDFYFEELKITEIKSDPERHSFFQGFVNFYQQSEITESYLKKQLGASSEKNYREISLVLLLKLYNRRQEYEKSLQLAADFSLLAQKNPCFFFYRGFAHQETGQFLSSLKDYHEAFKLKNNLPFIYNYSDLNWKLPKNTADVLDLLKRRNLAEKFYLSAHRSLENRKSPEILAKLAKLKFLAGKYEDAYSFFRELFQQEKIPINILREAKGSFLNLLLYLDYQDDFIEILVKDIFDQSSSITRIADSFYLNENFYAALQLYLLALKKFGIDSRLLFKVAYLCSRMKMLDQAAEYFEKYLEIESDDLDALNNLAFIYLNLEKTVEAEKYYQRILAKNSFSFEANLYLAMIYISREEKERAFAYLEQAKTLNPLAPELINLFKIFKKEFS